MNEQTNPELVPEPEQTPGSDPNVVDQGGSRNEHALELGSDPMIEVKRILEAALLASPDPLTLHQMKRLFQGEVDADNIRKVLDELVAALEPAPAIPALAADATLVALDAASRLPEDETNHGDETENPDTTERNHAG